MGSSFWAAVKEWEVWRNSQDKVNDSTYPDFKELIISMSDGDLSSLLNNWCESVAIEGASLDSALPKIDFMLKELSARHAIKEAV